jgi:radical SAM superfamily enzyme YgiQ (UPF0313 family)
MTELSYDLPLYRPPSEAENLIVQATLGCSFNRCTFCAMYKTKAFRARDLAEVFYDIDRAGEVSRETRRVFLADGDALVLPTGDLLAILDKLGKTLPDLQRVTLYALPANLLKKSVEELRSLREHKLTLVYYGIESGSPDILRRIRKGATPQGMIEGLTKAREAGIKTSCTVILGLGGKKRWRDHIEATAALANAAAPNFVSTLQLMLDETTLEDFLTHFGEPFEFQDDAGILAELELFVSLLAPESPVIFRSNHASNALPLAGTLPKDKARLLGEIRAAREGSLSLRPEWARAL